MVSAHLKNMLVKLDHFPKKWVKKNVWNHHLEDLRILFGALLTYQYGKQGKHFIPKFERIALCTDKSPAHPLEHISQLIRISAFWVNRHKVGPKTSYFCRGIQLELNTMTGFARWKWPPKKHHKKQVDEIIICSPHKNLMLHKKNISGQIKIFHQPRIPLK